MFKKEKTNFKKGVDAERLAADYLQAQGYSILKNRYKTKFGEIDLIIQHKNLIAFVEVSEERRLKMLYTQFNLVRKLEYKTRHCILFPRIRNFRNVICGLMLWLFRRMGGYPIWTMRGKRVHNKAADRNDSYYAFRK